MLGYVWQQCLINEHVCKMVSIVVDHIYRAEHDRSSPIIPQHYSNKIRKYANGARMEIGLLLLLPALW